MGLNREDSYSRGMGTIRHASMGIRAASYDAAARSCEAVLATERPVRMGREDEILVASGATFPAQIPLLDSHARGSVRSQLGSIRDIRSEGDALVGRLYLAETEEARAAAVLIDGGHLTDVSVGYAVEEASMVKPGAAATVAGRSYTAGDVPLRVATRWRLMEGSLTPIGADTAAKLRSEEKTMSEQAAAPSAPATPNEVEVERKRAAAIYSLARGGHADLVSRAVTEGWDEGRAAREILAAERAAVTPAVGQAPVGIAFQSRDAKSQGEALAEVSMAFRNMLGVTPKAAAGATQSEASEFERMWDRGTRKYRGMDSLEGAIRQALAAVNIDPGMGRTSAAMAFIGAMRNQTMAAYNRDGRMGGARAFSTFDLNDAFSTAFNALLQMSFEAEGNPYSGVVEYDDVADFRDVPLPRVTTLGSLRQLPAGGEAEHFAAGDTKETLTVSRFAAQAQMDDQMIINDNLSAITQMIRLMGEAGRRVEPDLIAAILLNGLTAGLTAGAIFSSGNTNVGTGALAQSTLATMVGQFTQQSETAPDGSIVSLNWYPRFLIVPGTLGPTADNLANSQFLVGSTAQGDKNPFYNRITPIVDARLANGIVTRVNGVKTTYTGSTTAYYLASGPGRGAIKVAYVRGSGRGPVMRSSVLTAGRFGIAYDVHVDVGAKATSYQGLARSTGA